jgi:hypothetical protein
VGPLDARHPQAWSPLPRFGFATQPSPKTNRMGTSSHKLLAAALACLLLSGCSPSADSKNAPASNAVAKGAKQAVSVDKAPATANDAPALGPADATAEPFAKGDDASGEPKAVAASAPLDDDAAPEPVDDATSDKAPASDRPTDDTAGGADSDDAPTDDARTDDANSDEPQARRGNSPGQTKQPAAMPDPVKQNGPIFQNWPDPKLALVLTGEQLGYIEPCGCAGLENQKGGLRRRHTFLKQLGDRGWPVIALDNGGLIRRFGRQAEIKFEKTAEALRTMDYQAVGFGTDDLKLPAGSVTSTVANSIFLSSNAALFGFDSEFTPRWRVIESGEMKVGVGQVLGDSLRKQVTNDEVQFLPAAKGLAEILPELKKARCDHYVLLAHATPEETRELALRFPLFDVVLTAHGADEPPHEADVIAETGQLLIEVGHKGMYAITLGFYSDPATPMRYQRVPLDHRFADSPAMDELMVAYQDQLKELGWEGLGLRRVAHPRGKFVGSNQCADCHAQAFEIWKDTPHAHATETLTQAKPPRQFDPECVSCHTTGWNAKEFMPYVSGYDSLAKTADLAGNGCENCHGPGAAHMAAESGDDESLRGELRRAMHLSIDGADGEAVQTSCMECHDIDNSPNFKFETYWPLIAHPEK